MLKRTSRQCVVCRKRDVKNNLLRLFINGQGILVVDDRNQYYGRRGVYLHRECGVGREGAVSKKIGTALKDQRVRSEDLVSLLDSASVRK